jgi:hypothetical protein
MNKRWSKQSRTFATKWQARVKKTKKKKKNKQQQQTHHHVPEVTRRTKTLANTSSCQLQA